MAWTPPKTWSDTQDRLNAANLNTFIRDNQEALRAEHAALAQRVTTQEASGYSDPLLRTVNLSNVGGANQVKLSNLTPPANTKLIYLAIRIESGSLWTSAPLIDYAIWNAFTEVAEGVDVVTDNRWDFITTSNASVSLKGFLAKGTNGVLAFGVSGFNLAQTRYDRVCVRWYV